jgi:TolB protein
MNSIAINPLPGRSIHSVFARLAPFFFLIFQFTACVEDKVEPLFLGNIRGVIVSQSTNQPLQDIEVSTAPASGVVLTNAQGQFEMEDIPEGEYTILTQADGYARESVKIKVIRNSTTNINLKLSAAIIQAPQPQNPLPVDWGTHQPLSVLLQWYVDNTYEDSLEYTIRVYESNQVTALSKAEHIRDTSFLVSNLKYNTTYYWQVDAISSSGSETSGNIWSFKTIPFPSNRIVFSTKKDGNYEIYSTDLAGDSLVRLTYSNSIEFKPLFSKQRSLVAFSSNASIDNHIYTMNADGSGMQKVTPLPIAGFHNQGIGFSWSPDNGKFIYSHYDKLYRVDDDGANLTLLATAPAGRNFRSCHWTSVGNKIVVETVGSLVYDSEIYLMNADGSGVEMLVNNLPGIIESPSFSVDGKSVLFTRDASGFESPDGRQLDARIFIININTQELTDVSDDKPDGTNDLQPRYSPDGAKIIFVNASNDGTGNKSIWIMDRDGSNRQLLFENAEMPHWQ